MTVAVKIQENLNKIRYLENEAYSLFQFKEIGFPKIFSYGHSGNYGVLVEELLGKTLEEAFKENKNQPKFIRLKDMLLTGIQVIDRIKSIHQKNYLHLDIKPLNFLLGNPDNSIIYIIDFGFAKKYRSSRTGRHSLLVKNKFFRGNLRFSSINTMKGIEPSRRDDLESLGYMLIYLYTQSLPWYNVNCTNCLELSKKIYEIKKLISIKMICEDTPKEMNEYLTYVKSLKFDEEPNYDYLKGLFEFRLLKLYNTKNINFSWINESLYRKNLLISSLKKRKVSPFSRIFQKINKEKSINDKSYITIDNSDIKLKTSSKINNYLTIEEKNRDNPINNSSSHKKNKSFLNNNVRNLNIKKKIDPNILNNNTGKIRFLSKKNVPNLSKANKIKSIKNNKKLSFTNKNEYYNFLITPIVSNKVINIFQDNSKIININQRINKEPYNSLNDFKKPLFYKTSRDRTSSNNFNELIDTFKAKKCNQRNYINNIEKDDNYISFCTDIIYKKKFHE